MGSGIKTSKCTISNQVQNLDGVNIKLGDLVEMKSGSPTMVVNKLLEDDRIEVAWFDFDEQDIRSMSGPCYAFKIV